MSVLKETLLTSGEGLDKFKQEINGLYSFDSYVFDAWINDVVSYFQNVGDSEFILEDIEANKKNTQKNYRLYKKIMEYLKLEK